jgi:CelD/BcsL family acetyltransferase involved in cellulose biosynthesis
MPIRIIDPVSDPRWDKFVEAHPHGTIFHHSVWSQVLRKRYGRAPSYYIEEDEHGEIRAAAPLFLVSRQFSGMSLMGLPLSEYGYPLGGSADGVLRLMERATAHVRRRSVSALEIRGWAPGANPAQAGLGVSSEYYGHVIDLGLGPDRLRSEFEKSPHLRRNLRHAEKTGLRVREATGPADLKEFHRLTVETRRRLDLLPWPYRFLDDIFQNLVRTGHGRLLLAELDGTITAGNMYLFSRDRVLLKFSASSKKYSTLRPNYFLTWKAIERFCGEKYLVYDFGITDLNNRGLRAFKKQWATEERLISYYRYPAPIDRDSKDRPRWGLGVYRQIHRLLPDIVWRALARLAQKRLC